MAELNPICSYCGDDAKLVTGKEIYPHRPDLYDKKFWQCWPCEAYVGCHPGTETSLGRLADKTLRFYKSQAHKAFDPMWKRHGMSRKQAYQWLADRLRIDVEDCHIGTFDVLMCNKVIEISRAQK